jgi:hypothetical protein
VLEIPYARYVQIIRRIAIEHARGEREEMRRAAFVGWQVHATMGGKTKYGEYLEMLGLDDKPQPETPVIDTTFDKAAHLEKMARIVAADQAARAQTQG